MTVAAVTKDFGVLACDSAAELIDEKMVFEVPKLYITPGRSVLSFIGSNAFLAQLELKKMCFTFDSTCIYLKDYLKRMKKKIVETSNKLPNGDKSINFCALVLGTHNNKPVMAQFNSTNDFKPSYVWEKGNGVIFSSIRYSEDTSKNTAFDEAKNFMEKKASKHKVLSPGIVGEILTRGIYKKADLEEEREGEKYAGGIVNAACVYANGKILPLSTYQVL